MPEIRSLEAGQAQYAAIEETSVSNGGRERHRLQYLAQRKMAEQAWRCAYSERFQDAEVSLQIEAACGNNDAFGVVRSQMDDRSIFRRLVPAIERFA